jgi:hypothetical protein
MFSDPRSCYRQYEIKLLISHGHGQPTGDYHNSAVQASICGYPRAPSELALQPPGCNRRVVAIGPSRPFFKNSWPQRPENGQTRTDVNDPSETSRLDTFAAQKHLFFFAKA